MANIKHKWDRLPEEVKTTAIEEIISFFENERDEKIGVVAAGQVLEFFISSAGKQLYNIGLDDAHVALQRRMEELNYDVDDLKEY